jgi:signal transduction histidine kinase
MAKKHPETKKNINFAPIKKFLLEHADSIQKLATKHHKEFLRDGKFRSEFIDKYQQNHIKVVNEFAKYLETDDLKSSTGIFKKLGNTIAEDSVRDELKVEEAVDGIIFLKQATWELLNKEGLLDKLTINEFYWINQVIGTFCDVVASNIAFTYHNKTQNKLEEALRSKDEFISAATHELKTPVTTLKGYTQILQKRLNSEGQTETLEFFGKMDAQINKLTSLIDDLLDVSRLDSGRLQFRMENFNFDEVVKETIDALQLSSTRHKISQDGSLGINVYGDKDRISQVISNLLINAIKYSPTADKIIVKTKGGKDSVTLSVHDFGIGIARQNQKKIFERFHRITEGKEATFPGIGLGLYICSEIVKHHGGEIWVKSEIGKGSVFYFSLPLKQLSDNNSANKQAEKEADYEKTATP